MLVRFERFYRNERDAVVAQVQPLQSSERKKTLTLQDLKDGATKKSLLALSPVGTKMRKLQDEVYQSALRHSRESFRNLTIGNLEILLSWLFLVICETLNKTRYLWCTAMINLVEFA